MTGRRRKCAPVPPVGPLKAKHISKEGCTLVWSPPEDDGGCEIIGYLVEKMDTSSGTWQEVGQFSGCEAKITNLITGKRYLFRVKTINIVGKSKALESDRQVLPTDPSTFQVCQAQILRSQVIQEEHERKSESGQLSFARGEILTYFHKLILEPKSPFSISKLRKIKIFCVLGASFRELELE